MFYIYILKSLSTGRFYIGSTENTVNRLTEHNSGKVKATRNFRPWIIIYTESFPTRSEADRRERQIKAYLPVLLYDYKIVIDTKSRVVTFTPCKMIPFY